MVVPRADSPERVELGTKGNDWITQEGQELHDIIITSFPSQNEKIFYKKGGNL